jgi:hypothetical protein
MTAHLQNRIRQPFDVDCIAAAAQAAAVGPPGGTSTSTAPGAAAAASGPPGTERTATAPGVVTTT